MGSDHMTTASGDNHLVPDSRKHGAGHSQPSQDRTQSEEDRVLSDYEVARGRQNTCQLGAGPVC